MVAMLPLPLPLRVWAWFRPVWTKDNFEHDTITSLQDRPRDGQQGVGGQLGAEARIWDHQRPLGASVLRQRGDSWGIGEPGGDGRLRERRPLRQDRPRDGQQGVGGQLGAEARSWDHQRPLGVSVFFGFGIFSLYFC